MKRRFTYRDLDSQGLPYLMDNIMDAHHGDAAKAERDLRAIAQQIIQDAALITAEAAAARAAALAEK